MVIDGQLRVLPGAKVTITGKKHVAAPDGTLVSGRHRVKHASDNAG